jgi:nicotinate-nucleotide adenylyltransferase
MPARLGVFGGTFDPPHIGHLVVGLYTFLAMSLDRVLFVISGEPWQKVGTRSISAAEDRLAMVEAAIAGRPQFATSRVEIDRGGPSYTVDTLRELAEQHPGAELFLILGADAAAGVPTWERPEELAGLATLVVVDRPGAPPVTLDGFRVSRVPIPALDLSSTELRARVAAGLPVDYLVPAGALTVLEERLLYREGA